MRGAIRTNWDLKRFAEQCYKKPMSACTWLLTAHNDSRLSSIYYFRYDTELQFPFNRPAMAGSLQTASCYSKTVNRSWRFGVRISPLVAVDMLM